MRYCGVLCGTERNCAVQLSVGEKVYSFHGRVGLAVYACAFGRPHPYSAVLCSTESAVLRGIFRSWVRYRVLLGTLRYCGVLSGGTAGGAAGYSQVLRRVLRGTKQGASCKVIQGVLRSTAGTLAGYSLHRIQ